MVQVSRQFQELARSSPRLRYQRDLFSADLVENPCIPCGFTQRRKLCEEHKHKWSSAGRTVNAVHELPEDLFSIRYPTTRLGRNLIASYNEGDSRLSFLRIRTAKIRKLIEWWSIPPFNFNVEEVAAYAPDNFLAIAEGKGR